jgi:hypothetical protein
MMPSSTLVVGCSEQLPNELRAYYLIGTSTEGAVLLSRHGATYSAAAREVSSYPALLERMLGVVLPSFPSSLRARARRALISRWNRDWGVEEMEGMVETTSPAANDNGSGLATGSLETSPSPTAPLRPTLEGDGSFPPRTAVTARQPSAAHG